MNYFSAQVSGRFLGKNVSWSQVSKSLSTTKRHDSSASLWPARSPRASCDTKLISIYFRFSRATTWLLLSCKATGVRSDTERCCADQPPLLIRVLPWHCSPAGLKVTANIYPRPPKLWVVYVLYFVTLSSDMKCTEPIASWVNLPTCHRFTQSLSYITAQSIGIEIGGKSSCKHSHQLGFDHWNVALGASVNYSHFPLLLPFRTNLNSTGRPTGLHGCGAF